MHRHVKLSYPRYGITLCLLIGLAACSTTQDGLHPFYRSIDVSKIPDAKPKIEKRSAYGNPNSYRVFGEKYTVLKTHIGYHDRGIASWYGYKFHKRRTSSGEPYNMFEMTAAHKTLPIPSYVQVTNLENGKKIVVRVNDRGPFHQNRIIDLSYVAAKKLGISRKGTGLVEVVALDPRSPFQILPKSQSVSKHSKPVLYLQVGSFRDKINAQHLSNRVHTLTRAPTLVKPGVLQQKVVYRVQIGPLQSIDESDKIKALLEFSNLGSPVTVVLLEKA